MATLVLQTAGEAAGNALGGPIGGMIGRVAGAAGGAAIDDALFSTGSGTRFVEGPRLNELGGLTSTEGAPVPRVYGRARIGGTLIWATRPLEVANTTVERSRSGSKGGAGGQKTVRTAYSYFIDLAVGLCAGEIALVRRIWADGTELDLTTLNLRVHTGSATQAPDPLIVAKEGAENAPAYRGLAYIVFERLPLAAFGNRIPQFAFEVIRPVAGLADRIRAVCLIPGSTEFGLDPQPVSEDAGFGATKPANRFQFQAASDVVASLDALQALCPRLTRVSVVTSWFGDDLRAGHCMVTPRIDDAAKATMGEAWAVAGLTRATARVVSRSGGTAAYGGTPSDAGLGRLVAELTRRGLAVVLYPFVMMDVAVGNALPNPHDPAGTQPPYPWRGRITCDPAPDRPGSPDGTPMAADQVAAFFEGPQGYRAMILHYAGLAAGWAASGAGLSGLILGSEFVGLTRVRGPNGAYPAVEQFRRLAAELRTRLRGVSLVYAADWTEYGPHVREGGASVRFPLDPLFADPAIDAVGIDYYPPISDWRDGPDHRDAAEADEIYDRAYLKRRLGAGEAFDWYYASPEDRAAQARTPITDGAQGKPWIYRPKDLVAWWSNPHVERAGGVETGPTAWTPQSKPIWLTEIGIPAVDRGTNGPNVFPDPKSSESARPPFSRGNRDDLIQTRGLDAILSRFDAASSDFEPAHNPASPLYGGRMIASDAMFVWAWDARPFPALPDFTGVWADADNWRLGHWITGRIEGLDLDRLIAAILADLGIEAPSAITAAGFLDGYVLDRPLSAREALEPLARLFDLDVAVSAGTLQVRGPRTGAPATLDPGDLVLIEGEDAPLRRVRAQESELPRSVEIGFGDGESPDYRRATAAAARPAGARRREVRVDAALVTRREAAQALAETALDAALAGRDTASLTLSPRRIDLEPGDRVLLPGETRGSLHRITRIDDSPAGRRIETRAAPSLVPDPGPRIAVPRPGRTPPALPGPVFAVPLVLPVERGNPVPLSYLAVAADPWPGAVAVWRAAGEGAPFELHRTLDHPACLGRTLNALPPGPLWRFDRNARLDVSLRHADGLSAVGEAAALAGGNLFALVGGDGAVEMFSAARAEMTGADTWRLSGLLRGLAGSEAAAGRAAGAGCLIVRLDDGAVAPLVERLDEAGRRFLYRVGPAERDPADPACVGFAASAGLDAFVPLSPVHLRARREAGGLRLSWIRRARRDADAWEPADVPLGEDTESYRLDILADDGRVLRSLSAATTSLLYADEIADFGARRTEIAFAVAQVGTLAGPGPARRARVSVLAA